MKLLAGTLLLLSIVLCIFSKQVTLAIQNSVVIKYMVIAGMIVSATVAMVSVYIAISAIK